jgi:hypothetical protein
VTAFTFFRYAIRRYASPGRHDSLGLILGADSCRAVLPSHGKLWEEPSLLVWQLRDRRILHGERAIGVVADNTFICRNEHLCQFVRMFDDESIVDSYVLSRVLRYFRAGGVDGPMRRMPGRLVLSGRPALLERIGPILASVAFDAGFWQWQVIAERDLLAPDAVPGTTVLVLDVGHTATRIHAWRDGQILAEATDAALSGAALIQTVVDAAALEGLIIGCRMARHALKQFDDPALALRGRDRQSSRPRIIPQPLFVWKALAERFDQIARMCQRMLREVGSSKPARLALAGGGVVPGLASFLRRGLPETEIICPPQPGLVSAHALMRLMCDCPCAAHAGSAA